MSSHQRRELFVYREGAKSGKCEAVGREWHVDYQGAREGFLRRGSHFCSSHQRVESGIWRLVVIHSSISDCRD